jgi:glycosyltransferase involved in cell wall biosynthesis
LIGSGSVLVAAKEYIADKKLTDQVTFYGEVKDPVKFIQNFDVFVNASEAEGFSNSLLEALLAGKVLISTPVSGASDAISNGDNGYVANSFSAADIRDSVLKGIKLHRSNTGKIKTFSDKLIADNFTVDVIAKQYVSLYKQLNGVS